MKLPKSVRRASREGKSPQGKKPAPAGKSVPCPSENVHVEGPHPFPSPEEIAAAAAEDLRRSKEALKFESEDTEALVMILKPLVEQHGIGKILTVLGEIS